MIGHVMRTAVLWAIAAVTPVVPGFAAAHAERRDLSEFSQASTSDGAFRSSPALHYDGRRAYQARFCGGSANGYARGVMHVRWPAGATVSYGVALFLPRDLAERQQGEIDLMRWDNYPRYRHQGDFGGIVLWNSDRQARLERGHYVGAPAEQLGPSFSLPRGRWFWLEVRQQLSGGSLATSQVSIDGRTVVSTTAPNSYDRPISRVRFGIVAIDQGSQQRPFDLWLDRATISRDPIGLPTASERAVPERSTLRVRNPAPVPSTCTSR
jgi:hypothetical protein